MIAILVQACFVNISGRGKSRLQGGCWALTAGNLVQGGYGEGRVGCVGERGDGFVVEGVARGADEEDGGAGGGRADEAGCG